ncbi:plant cysteine oxidase 3-like [Bidens hawaiensis]|uniref:plant cysteine oxidase 3-like n=1 Tax=Bidens hawaiensis TaxID=980011 RepID=UPI0040494EB8
MSMAVKPTDEKPKINEEVINRGDHDEKRVKRKRRYMAMVRTPPRVIASQLQPPLQRLYISCTDVFKDVGMAPSPPGVQQICQILDGMMPDDVGIERLQFVDNDTTVIYKVICHNDNFLLYLLLLPENAIIPLHGHPGMTVFSKLLLGEVSIKAYDMVEDPDVINQYSPPSPQLELACLEEEGVLAIPCNTKVLYPNSGGNIHEFKAITPCAILDVAAPPFSKSEGRDCIYYNDVADAVLPNENMSKKEEGKRYRWLEKTIFSEELLKMEWRDYTGLRIIE